jgi:hypothetical protein
MATVHSLVFPYFSNSVKSIKNPDFGLFSTDSIIFLIFANDSHGFAIKIIP